LRSREGDPGGEELADCSLSRSFFFASFIRFLIDRLLPPTLFSFLTSAAVHWKLGKYRCSHTNMHSYRQEERAIPWSVSGLGLELGEAGGPAEELRGEAGSGAFSSSALSRISWIVVWPSTCARKVSNERHSAALIERRHIHHAIHYSSVSLSLCVCVRAN
jgi:hypothetical protein